MPIREFFHLIHVVDDINQANERWGALFGAEPYGANWSDLDHRWASFMTTADMMLEVIQPRHEPEDEAFALTKFHRRFGQHLHSLSWYVDMADMPALFQSLRSSGIRVAKPGGGLFPDDTVDPGQTMFTHPKDTGGQLEFVGVTDGPLTFEPRADPSWSPPAPDQSPLTAVGLSHFTTSTRDLPTLESIYVGLLGAEKLHESANSVFVKVGSESVVELAQPSSSESLLGRDVEANGELPHGLTYRVVDLEAAERHASGLGLRTVDRSGGKLVLDPDDMFGAVVAFTDQPPFEG